MRGVFISYRRDDTAGHAGRLFDHLRRAFGPDGVFMDLDDIGRGDTYADTLNAKLRECDVLIAVVGRRWLTLTDAAGRRRLDHPDDWVRAEIRTALTSGHLVIPVRVDGAPMPSEADLPEDIRGLLARQWADVRDGSSFDNDVEDLSRDIRKRRAKGTWSEWFRMHRVAVAAVLVMALAAGGYSAYAYARANRVTVPRVSGLALERATQALTDIGLRAGTASPRETNDYTPGSVIEQTPAAQVMVSKGTAIVLIVAAPKAVDLSPYVRVRHQGQSGTVAAAACATAMSAALRLQGRPTELSMRYLHERSQRVDELKDGTYLDTVLYVARRFGAPPEDVWPYNWQVRKLPAGKSLQDMDEAAAPFKAQISKLAGVDAVLGALAKGMPVIAGAEVFESWDAPKDAVITQPVAGSPDRGPTAITIVGYDPATRRFKFANSWGTTWGDKGFGYFTRDDADKILLHDLGLWSVDMSPQ